MVLGSGSGGVGGGVHGDVQHRYVCYSEGCSSLWLFRLGMSTQFSVGQFFHSHHTMVHLRNHTGCRSSQDLQHSVGSLHHTHTHQNHGVGDSGSVAGWLLPGSGLLREQLTSTFC